MTSFDSMYLHQKSSQNATNNTESLDGLISSVFQVLQRADKDDILSTQFPGTFREQNLLTIADSLRLFLEGVEEFKNPVTVLHKYNAGKYKKLLDLYRDIKVACCIRIKDLKIGSESYKSIDFFYKFATELMMRESSLFASALASSEGGVSELEEQISSDFQKIGYNYAASNGEVVTYLSEVPNPNLPAVPNFYGQNSSVPTTIKQPLFSSQLGKSELDLRLTLIPEPFNLAKLIPLPRNSGASGSSFELLNTQVSKIPLPTNKPTTVLDDFLYVTWYVIKAPEWLRYKGKILKAPVNSSVFKGSSNDKFRTMNAENEAVKSFAPTFDSTGAGVSEILKNNVWLNQVGFKKIDQIRDEYLKKLGKPKPEKPSETKEEPKKTSDPEPEKQLLEYNETMPIDIEKVLKWDPRDIEELDSIKNDKQELNGSAEKLQQLISRDLLKLNKLRQERFLRSTVNNLAPPTLGERTLHKKITKLITLAFNYYKISPGDLPLEFSKRVPVLMTDYSGTLPSLPASKSRTTRLPTIRGPYKKKNRL